MIDFTAKEALTFDCYGTLIDWETGLARTLSSIFGAHGLAWPGDEGLEIFGELEAAAESGPFRPYREVLRTVLRGLGERYGFSPSDEEEERFAESVGDWPAFPDSAGALARLKTRFRLVIVSNVDDDLFARSNRLLGVGFDSVVTAQQVQGYKPSPGHFRVALERLGLPKEKVVHVAQSLYHDHAPAKALGFETVWVNRRQGQPGGGATKAAQAAPDLEVPDLATLARLALIG